MQSYGGGPLAHAIGENLISRGVVVNTTYGGKYFYPSSNLLIYRQNKGPNLAVSNFPSFSEFYLSVFLTPFCSHNEVAF